MSLQSFRISPDQWREFDTYEGRFQIETMCAENVAILCDNIHIVPSLIKDSLLPEFFIAEKGVYPQIDGVRLTFVGVSYLKLRGSLFDPIKNEWIKGADNQQVVLAHSMGKAGAAKYSYDLSGVGRLIWPPIAADNFVIETSALLTLEFDDQTYFPTGFRSPKEANKMLR